jgi:hypothetical protein
VLQKTVQIKCVFNRLIEQKGVPIDAIWKLARLVITENVFIYPFPAGCCQKATLKDCVIENFLKLAWNTVLIPR